MQSANSSPFSSGSDVEFNNAEVHALMKYSQKDRKQAINLEVQRMIYSPHDPHLQINTSLWVLTIIILA